MILLRKQYIKKIYQILTAMSTDKMMSPASFKCLKLLNKFFIKQFDILAVHPTLRHIIYFSGIYLSYKMQQYEVHF